MKEPYFELEEVIFVVGRIISELDQWKNITKQIFSKLCVENEGAKFWVRRGHWQLLVVGRIISELDQWKKITKQIFSKLWVENEGAKFWVRKGHWQFLVVGSIISELDQRSNCFPNFWKMKEPEKVNDS